MGSRWGLTPEPRPIRSSRSPEIGHLLREWEVSFFVVRTGLTERSVGACWLCWETM
jgi:hypothetical protein